MPRVLNLRGANGAEEDKKKKRVSTRAEKGGNWQKKEKIRSEEGTTG